MKNVFKIIVGICLISNVFATEPQKNFKTELSKKQVNIPIVPVALKDLKPLTRGYNGMVVTQQSGRETPQHATTENTSLPRLDVMSRLVPNRQEDSIKQTVLSGQQQQNIKTARVGKKYMTGSMQCFLNDIEKQCAQKKKPEMQQNNRKSYLKFKEQQRLK